MDALSSSPRIVRGAEFFGPKESESSIRMGAPALIARELTAAETARDQSDDAARILGYLRRRRESCLSRLSVDLLLPPAVALQLLLGLERAGKVEQRPDITECDGGASGETASRWGLPTYGWLRRMLGAG